MNTKQVYKEKKFIYLGIYKINYKSAWSIEKPVNL